MTAPLRASSALSMMKPMSPATASAISSASSYSHHSASIIESAPVPAVRLPQARAKCQCSGADRFLGITGPVDHGTAIGVGRRPVAEFRHGETAGPLVDGPVTAGAHHFATEGPAGA